MRDDTRHEGFKSRFQNVVLKSLMVGSDWQYDCDGGPWVLGQVN